MGGNAELVGHDARIGSWVNELVPVGMSTSCSGGSPSRNK